VGDLLLRASAGWHVQRGGRPGVRSLAASTLCVRICMQSDGQVFIRRVSTHVLLYRPVRLLGRKINVFSVLFFQIGLRIFFGVAWLFVLIHDS